MDLKKYNKPIHFTCPKCHADFEFAGGEIVKQKNDIHQHLMIVNAKIQTELKRKHGHKTPYYYDLMKQAEDLKTQYSAIKKAAQLASEQSEIHLFILFKIACKKRWGDEVINKMLKECEEELVFKNYDMAIQKHNNFEGA